MVQIGNVPAIVEVKDTLDQLKKDGLVKKWELPYENLLTRRDAAIFFLEAADDSRLDDIWSILGEVPRFTYKKNEEKALSLLPWQVEFNKELEVDSPNEIEEKSQSIGEGA